MPQVRDRRGDTRDRRTGHIDDRESSGERPLVPTAAHWPIDVDPEFDTLHRADPWVMQVRDSIVAYRAGRTDVADWSWARDITWRLVLNGGDGEEHRGAEQVFAYHRRLQRLTDGTFRQRLVALEGSAGPHVEATLRTTARHGRRELDVPTLIVFELHGGRIQRVTEMPGDPHGWTEFWTS
jgi:hypothetical protein